VRQSLDPRFDASGWYPEWPRAVSVEIERTNRNRLRWQELRNTLRQFSLESGLRRRWHLTTWTDTGGRAEGGGRRAEGGGRRAKGGGRRAEGGGQRAKGGGRRAKGEGRRAEGGESLENTGGFQRPRWARSAPLMLTGKGEQPNIQNEMGDRITPTSNGGLATEQRLRRIGSGIASPDQP
jgi:hypothetical protein